jgi:hypothetical protein
VQLVVIANTGSGVITLTSVSVSGDFVLAANTCGVSLAPANSANDSCTVSIAFRPTVSGSCSGELTVVDSVGTQTAQLFGTGQNAATDIITPLSLVFGSQTIGSMSSPQQVTLANNGDQALLNIAIESSSSAFMVANGCGTSLPGHSICALSVSFLPSAIGTQSGTITVSDMISTGSSANSHSQQIAVSGTGLAPLGTVSAAPSSLNFGYYAVGMTSPAQTISVTNNGTSTITGVQGVITGDFSLQAASKSPCGINLPVGQTCYIGVAFSPSQVNQRTGSLSITSNSLPSPLVISLSGNGGSFSMKVNGAASQIVTGSQAAQPFQVEIDPVNGSNGPVALTCAVVPATATCAVTPESVMLTGGSTQLVSVEFSEGQQARSETSWNAAHLLLALLVPFGLLRRGRRWRALALCAFLILLPPMGCGVNSSAGSGASGSGQGSPSSAQYALTVTGNMPGVSHTVTMQVDVQ